MASGRKTWIVAGILFGIHMATAVVCSQPAAATPLTDQWVVAVAEEATTLDPTISYDAGSSLLQQHIMDPLVDVEGPDFRIVPKLAESYEIINDTTWRFHLRKGVKFHNGEPFDAEDVKYSFEQYKGPNSPRQREAKMIKSVNIIDPSTVEIVTVAPYPPFLVNITSLLIVPSTLHKEVGSKVFGKNPVGTGPYKLHQWTRDQRLVLEANQNYWRGPVLPKKLIFRQIKYASTRVAELVTGGVQIAKNIPLAQVNDIQRSGARVLSGEGGMMMLYPINTSKKPFDDVRVRTAINLAIDKDAIANRILEGYGRSFSGFMPNMFGYNSDVKPYAYDPEKAKQLLKEAGYPDGFNMTWSISSGVFVKDRDIAEYIAGQLAEVGIKVDLRPTERAKLQTDFKAGKFDMTSVKWNAGSEPDRYLKWTYYKRPYYNNPAAFKLIDEGEITVNPDDRRAIYQKLHKILHDDAVLLFTHAQEDLYGVAKNVDWKPYPVRASTQQFYFWMVPEIK